MSVLGHRLRGLAGTAFDPRTAFAWDAVYWGNDPDWANPGNGVKVASWRDGSGNSRHLTSPGVVNQPTFRSTVASLNNRAAIEYIVGGDSDDFQEVTFTRAQPFSWVIVLADHLTDGGRILTSGAGVQTIRNGAAPSPFIHYAGGFGNNTAASVANNVGALYSVYFNGAASYPALNGTAGAADNPSTNGMTVLRVASRLAPDFSSNMKAAFIGAIAADFHTQPNYAAFKSWVASYYGLSIA